MTALQADMFTREELNAIGANGCGSKSGWPKVPNFCWEVDCNNHDGGYWIGGDDVQRNRLGKLINLDRRDRDDEMFAAMLMRNKSQPWYKQPHLGFFARRYYWAVRSFGAGLNVFGKVLITNKFHNGPKRTRAELDMAVNKFNRQERMR